MPMVARGGVDLHGVKRTRESLEGRRLMGDSCHGPGMKHQGPE